MKRSDWCVLVSTILLLAIAGCSIFFPEKEKCGKWRWDVKTLTDADANTIDTLNIVQSTIFAQLRMQAPGDLNSHSPRLKSEEREYRLTGLLLRYKEESDYDYHIVLAEKGDTNNSIIIEIPSPDDCPATSASLFKYAFTQVRNDFVAILDKHHRPKPEFLHAHFLKKSDPIYLTVIGVGFWDMKDHGKGAAPNGREIHPVLKIEEQ